MKPCPQSVVKDTGQFCGQSVPQSFSHHVRVSEPANDNLVATGSQDCFRKVELHTPHSYTFPLQSTEVRNDCRQNAIRVPKRPSDFLSKRTSASGPARPSVSLTRLITVTLPRRCPIIRGPASPGNWTNFNVFKTISG